jgi:hypothetical protein
LCLRFNDILNRWESPHAFLKFPASVKASALRKRVDSDSRVEAQAGR